MPRAYKNSYKRR